MYVMLLEGLVCDECVSVGCGENMKLCCSRMPLYKSGPYLPLIRSVSSAHPQPSREDLSSGGMGLVRKPQVPCL